MVVPVVEVEPISDQFIVLERRHPALRSAAYEGSGEGGTGGAPGWGRIPLGLRLVLCLALAATPFLLPLYLIYRFGVFRKASYTLYQYAPIESANDWLELARWLIMGLILGTGLVLTHYLSILVPQLMAFIARRGRKTLAPGLVTCIEIVSLVWRYLCYNAIATVLWITSLHIMPFPRQLLEKAPEATAYWSRLPWQFYAERLFCILFVSALLLTLEKVLLHLIAKEFNRSLYRERIQKCLYSLWTIDVLRKAATLFNYVHVTERSPNFDKLWRLKSYPYASADLMTVFILEHFVKLGKKSGERKQTLARRIFRFLVPPHRADRLLAEDIRPFFCKGEAERVFAGLDFNHTDDISESEFVRAVDAIYQERADLITVLVTNSDVVSRLDNLMLTLVAILLLIIIFPLIGFSPSEALMPLGVSLAPTIVACTLIFGETIKSIFAALVFLLATHPYDVGDRVYMEQGNYFVRKIGLLSTMFERWDGLIVYIPNSVLATKAICNVRRTGFQSQRVELVLPASISRDRLAELEGRLEGFVQAESRDFASIRSARYEMREVNQLVLVITLRHRFNFFDGYDRCRRNNRFMLFLKQSVHDLGIEYCTTVRTVVLARHDEHQYSLSHDKGVPFP